MIAGHGKPLTVAQRAYQHRVDRLRAIFLQEMLVLHEELAAIRRHISQLGRENGMVGVKQPLISLSAGDGTVFRVEKEVSSQRHSFLCVLPLTAPRGSWYSAPGGFVLSLNAGPCCCSGRRCPRRSTAGKHSTRW